MTDAPVAPQVADYARYRNLVVARIVCATLGAMAPRWPENDPEIEGYALDELEMR